MKFKFRIPEKIKAALHATFLSSTKRKVITAGTVATVVGLGVADFALGAKLLTKFGYTIPPNHSILVKQNPCVTPACKGTEKAIVEAVDIWRSLAVEREDISHIPSYLNARYALRAAGVESDLGRLSRANSQFEGIFQFSCVNKRLLLHHRMKAVVNLLNAARRTVPALQGYEGDRITASMVCNKKYRHIYNHPTVQTLIKMETALVAAIGYEKKYPGFRGLSEYEKHGILYLGHNLPVMVPTVLKYKSCDRRVWDIIPAQRSNFRANKGVYANGDATPSELLARTANFTEPYIKDHKNWLFSSSRPHYAAHWGENGVTHWLYGQAIDKLTCPSKSVTEDLPQKKKKDKSKKKTGPSPAVTKKAELSVLRLGLG